MTGNATPPSDGGTRSGGDPGDGDGRNRMAVDPYLARIGLDPDAVADPNLATLERIQRAHVTSVPFENLAIVGDPHGDREGAGVPLATPRFYEKIVDRGRGGYCFELNGLCHWLLAELGYDIDRVAARVTSDGEARPPANHHTNVVELDRRYVVDVGMGVPTMRGPLPLDGTARTDDVGVTWRVAASDRPDATFRTEFRTPGADEFATRYVFSDVPRDLEYFRATNDFLQHAPESPFTRGPRISIATDDGHRKLSADTLTEITGGEEHERAVSVGDWHGVLEREFGIGIDPP